MGFMTRLAARSARRKNNTRVVYFAHGFHFWNGAPKINWLLFYPIEKIGAHLTDVLVTMNTEDFERAKKHIHAKQVLYTYGIGVDLTKFHPKQGVREKKRAELGVDDNTFMLYSTSELNDRKNLTLAVDIVSILKEKGYNVHFFDRGVGENEELLKQYAKEKNISDSFTLLGYGKDVDEMCLAADAFLFTSKQEGLPVAVMEAMSSRLPCVVSKIRGVTDLVKDGKGGFVCSIDNANEYCEKIIYLIENNNDDFKNKLTESNNEVLKPYSFDNVAEFILKLAETV
ncbi:MAG: glycosyltransferase [Clostridiales bacterium]|nr:glycosyltransferase [Clostridiales bacterium]